MMEKFTLLITSLMSLLAALLLSGCAATSRYEIPQPLTTEIVQSLDGNITAHVPAGWFSATDSVVARHLLLWFVRDDYAATMGLRQISVESDEEKRIAKEGILPLAKVSLELKRLRAGSAFRVIAQPKIFKRQGEDYASYEYSPNGKDIVRVIVFSAKGKCYEFAALPVSERGLPEDPVKLFSTQQSVFASMRW
jgi:hypothetical protein